MKVLTLIYVGDILEIYSGETLIERNNMNDTEYIATSAAKYKDHIVKVIHEKTAKPKKKNFLLKAIDKQTVRLSVSKMIEERDINRSNLQTLRKITVAHKALQIGLSAVGGFIIGNTLFTSACATAGLYIIYDMATYKPMNKLYNNLILKSA